MLNQSQFSGTICVKRSLEQQSPSKFITSRVFLFDPVRISVWGGTSSEMDRLSAKLPDYGVRVCERKTRSCCLARL